MYGNEFYYNISYGHGGVMEIADNMDIYDNLFFKNKANCVPAVNTLESNDNAGIIANLYQIYFLRMMLWIQTGKTMWLQSQHIVEQ